MKFCQLFFVIIVISCLARAQDFNDEVAFKKIGSYSPPDAKYTKLYWVPRHFEVEWVYARPLCKAYGFDILTLETLEEMQRVVNMCSENEDMFGAYTHIGGMTSVGRSRTNWYWVTTNQKISYNMPWHNGQPEFKDNIEWCLTLTKSSGKYNDIPCYGSWAEAFICQSYKGEPNVTNEVIF